MLKQIVGKVWRTTPSFLRWWAVRITQKKFTVSVGAIVFNEENKILLLDHVLRPASGWGIPGGFIESGEQPVDAIQRELQEEIGLKIKNIEIVYIRTTFRHVEIIVSALADGEARVKSFEIKNLEWFDFERLPKQLSIIYKQIIKDLLSKKTKC